MASATQPPFYVGLTSDFAATERLLLQWTSASADLQARLESATRLLGARSDQMTAASSNMGPTLTAASASCTAAAAVLSLIETLVNNRIPSLTQLLAQVAALPQELTQKLRAHATERQQRLSLSPAQRVADTGCTDGRLRALFDERLQAAGPFTTAVSRLILLLTDEIAAEGATAEGKKVLDAQARIGGVKSAVLSAQGELEKARKLRAEKQARLDDINNQITEKNKAVAQENETARKADNDSTAAYSRLTDARNKVSSLSTTISNKESEKKKVDDQIAVQIRNISSVQQQISREAKAGATKKTLDALAAERGNYERERDRLLPKQSALQTDIDSLKAQKATAASDVTTYQGQYNDAATRCQAARTRVSNLQSEIFKLNGSATTLKQELQALDEQITRLQNDLQNQLANQQALEKTIAQDKDLENIPRLRRQAIDFGRKLSAAADLVLPKLDELAPAYEKYAKCLRDGKDQLAGVTYPATTSWLTHEFDDGLKQAVNDTAADLEKLIAALFDPARKVEEAFREALRKAWNDVVATVKAIPGRVAREGTTRVRQAVEDVLLAVLVEQIDAMAFGPPLTSALAPILPELKAADLGLQAVLELMSLV